MAPKRVVPFDQAARQWLETKSLPGLKSQKDQTIWLRRLETYIFPHLGKTPVDAIDSNAVVAALEPIWRDKTETASRLRGKIENILDWASTAGLRHGDNPARWSGCIEHMLPSPGKIAKVEHHAALPYAELPAFWAKLNAYQGKTRQARVTADALAWCILTASRSGETRGAKASEIDFDKRWWAIPAERMKAGQEHVVPLPDQAIWDRYIWRVMRGDRLAPGATLFPVSDTAMRNLACKIAGTDITIHGFRSSFRDWCAETGVSPELAERALAHTLKSKVEAAYNRTALVEQRRPLMEAWADFLAGKIPSGDR
jgi:integrase